MVKIMVNGAIKDGQAATVSVYDHGFMYGIGLFETFRTYNGIPFLLKEHMDRLHTASVQLGIAWEPNLQELEQHIAQLLQVNRLVDGVFRYTVSAGLGGASLPTADYDEPNTIIYVREAPSRERIDEAQRHGKSLQLLETKRDMPEAHIRFKSFQFMNNVIAKKELKRYAWAKDGEGLFLNVAGHIAEGIVSNVFFVRDGKLHTPHVETGILAGITRGYVLQLCEQQGIPYEEGFYLWDDLIQADEVFITNSTQEITPVGTLYDLEGKRHVVGEQTVPVGEVTARLIALYRNRTGGI